MDGRKNNGGHSTKGRAGRKPKTEELQLIEKLKPLEPLAYEALKEGLKKTFKEEETYFLKLKEL